MDAQVLTAQAVSLQLNAAMAYYYQAAGRNDHAQALAQANLVNCYRKLLHMTPFIPWTGYTVPADCTGIANVLLARSTFTPGQLVSVEQFSYSATNGGEVLTSFASTPLNVSNQCEADDPGYCCYYPFDPYCTGFFSGGGGGSQPTTIINNYYDTYNTNYYSTGVSNADVFSIVDGSLASMWSVIVGAVDASLIYAISQIQAALNAIGNALKGVFSVLARLAGLVLKALQTILQELLKGLVGLLKRVVSLLDDLWRKVIAPALKVLSDIRKQLMKIYERYIRPVLIIIQQLRKLLAILKIFHVKWASKLDAVLQDIQSRISGTFLYLLAYTNMLANWINLIMTAGYLIQRPIWLNSLNAYKGSSTALVLSAMTSPADAAAAAALAKANSLPSTTQSTTAGLAYMRSQSGPYQPLVDTQAAQFQQYLQGTL